MKTTYHLCWSGGDELLFRTREDYIHGIICLCIACYETGNNLLAYCLMSNHAHICVRGDNIKALIKAFRYSYTRYFNSKYRRRGKLGERDFFKLEIHGLHHLLTAIAYILRNPLHHGICDTPFEYEFSSIKASFATELGHITRERQPKGIIPHSQLPSRHRFPPHMKTDNYGNILAQSLVDKTDLEHQFSTARSYLYFMNRLSGESWENEQMQDANNLPPVKIEDIEHGIGHTSIREMLANETGRRRRCSITDIILCESIEKMISRQHKNETVYTISEETKYTIAQSLKAKHHIPDEQLFRCLAINQRTNNHK